MGFLTTKQQIFILLPIILLIILSIVLNITDKNYNKQQFYNQYGEGRVVLNDYNSSCHCHTIKLSDSQSLNLDDIRIISMIKKNDWIVKKKNNTFFIVYKADQSRIFYDMYNKNLKIIK
ncbi:hypothetical protein [Chryseobacterium viscerum]|uniref:Uncharacterized protein n=1 Tax=Chryseobacterium viscerum TaxID=1037377 RepID=A0A316WD19_9FLAO|nr:hypothetical protein [Chryseobacterium viscerum]PWN57542.1 hypothetical protein C1634_025625 [Chryseobacterium viscerum]